MPCSESRTEAISSMPFLYSKKIKNMEGENDVRSKQSSPNSKGTTCQQHHGTRAMRNKVDTDRTSQTECRRDGTVLRS